MEGGKRDEGSAKKMKYVPPGLISLDKDEGAEGNGDCIGGSGAAASCNVGSSAGYSCGGGSYGGA
jgi:hypothetical protein